MSPIPIKKNWLVAEPLPSAVNQALSEYPYFLRQILYNRNVSTADQAAAYLSALPGEDDPFLLMGMEEAVETLFEAIDHKVSVVVYGDYDVDGVTGTTLLVQVLQVLGAVVRPYIPNRFDEGYGLNKEALETLAADGVKLVVTVDCGIRSPVEAAYARELGLQMIISDHHHPAATLPDVQAVICQKQPGDIYPDKDLAGVGLAYKIAQALLARRPVAGVMAEDWLDLVALGTVADIVPLHGENRSLVRRGLIRLRHGRRMGLRSLAQAAGLVVEQTSAGDIGYVLGPRLNAAGRLESALDALNLLMSADLNEAAMLAQKLDDQNRRRQQLTLEMQTESERQIGPEDGKYLLCAFDAGFNSGVVGLAASRLCETHYRPAIVGQVSEKTTRASCRSIPQFHITRALDECSDLLVRHGGHAAAAGFTVENQNLEALVNRLQEIAQRELGGQELRPVLKADLQLPLGELNPRMLDPLRDLQPTGLSNPEATFVSRNLRVMRVRPVGSERQHLKLTVCDDSRITYDAIAFRQGHWAECMPERIDLLYTFEKNVFMGRESLQLNVKDLKPSGEPD